MVLALAGALLAALGLFSGLVLVIAPLGLAPLAAGPALWVLFPLLSLGGFTLIAIGARTAPMRGLMVGISYVLLGLALASAVGLVAGAAALLQPVQSTVSLWYVLAVAGTLGALGVATHGKSGPDAAA
jgi:hypothetical protein